MTGEVIQLFPKGAEPSAKLERQFLHAAMEWAEPFVRQHLDMNIVKTCDLKLYGLLVNDIIAVQSGKGFTIEEKRGFLRRLDYLLVLQGRQAAGEQPPEPKSPKSRKKKGR